MRGGGGGMILVMDASLLIEGGIRRFRRMLRERIGGLRRAGLRRGRGVALDEDRADEDRVDEAGEERDRDDDNGPEPESCCAARAVMWSHAAILPMSGIRPQWGLRLRRGAEHSAHETARLLWAGAL